MSDNGAVDKSHVIVGLPRFALKRSQAEHYMYFPINLHRHLVTMSLFNITRNCDIAIGIL